MALFSRKSIIYYSVGLLMLCAGGCASDVSLFQSSPSTPEAPTTGAPVETAPNPDIDQVAMPAPQRQADGPSIELMKHYRAWQKSQETQTARSKATQEAGEAAQMKQQLADEQKQLADTQAKLADAQQQAAAKDASITTMHDDLTTTQTALGTAQKGEQDALEGKRTAEQNNYKWIAATAGLGIAALFGLAAAGLLLWRQRKQASAAPLTFDPTDGSPVTEPLETIKPSAALDNKKPEDGEKATNIVLPIVPTPPPILPQAAPNTAGTPAAIPEWLRKPQNTPGNKGFPKPAPILTGSGLRTKTDGYDFTTIPVPPRAAASGKDKPGAPDPQPGLSPQPRGPKPTGGFDMRRYREAMNEYADSRSHSKTAAVVAETKKPVSLPPLPWNQTAKPLSRETFVPPEWLTEEARKLAAAKAVKASTAPETATTAFSGPDWMRVVKLHPEEEALREAWIKYLSGNPNPPQGQPPAPSSPSTPPASSSRPSFNMRRYREAMDNYNRDQTDEFAIKSKQAAALLVRAQETERLRLETEHALRMLTDAQARESENLRRRSSAKTKPKKTDNEILREIYSRGPSRPSEDYVNARIRPGMGSLDIGRGR